MALGTTPPRNDYIGNGAVATYTYGFRIYDATDLKVTKRDTLGVETPLVYPTDFSVTGVDDPAGGTITLLAGNLTSGYALTIRFFEVPRQPNDLRNQGGYFAEVHEDEFDRLTRYAQQTQDSIDRAMKLPETEVGTPVATTVPSALDRASRFFAWDASGNPIASSGAPDLVVPVSVFMESLLVATTALAARAVLGALSSAPGSVTTTEILDGTILGGDLNDSVINDLPTVTIASGDFLAISDVSDSNKKKKSPVSGLLNLATSGTLAQGAALLMNPFTINTLQTQAHGLGVLPLLYFVQLINIVADGGWNPGEHVILPMAVQQGGAGYTITADGTNVELSTASAFAIVQRAGTGSIVITTSRWQMQVVPFALR
jgi:hypothetical protein